MVSALRYAPMVKTSQLGLMTELSRWWTVTPKERCWKTCKVVERPYGTDGLWAAAWSPSVPQILCGCGDGSIRKWEVESGDCVAKTRVTGSLVFGIVFTHDGERIISGSKDGFVRV